MGNKKTSAGDHIDSRCTRCKEMTNHTIVAMVGEKVARVQCNICNGLHNYYSPKPPGEAAPKKAPVVERQPRRTARGGAAAERQEWLAFRNGVDPQRAIRYEMGRCYRTNDLLDHPSFGLGVVRAVIKPNKMEVLFEDGKKLLRCAP